MDEKHSITFNNGLADLTIRMNDNLTVLCKNGNFPDLPETLWTDNLIPPNCLGIISVLKETPPKDYKDSFTNRWEEIKTIVTTNLFLNKK